MKDDNKNRRKIAIGAMIAAGVTTGALAMGAGNGASAPGAGSSAGALTAADMVIIDGCEVTAADMALADKKHRGSKPNVEMRKTMYGPRPKMYGPKIDPNKDPRFQEREDSIRVNRQVVNIVFEQLELGDAMIALDARFVEELGADSLDVVEIIIAVEKEFKITIPDEKLEQLTTTEKLISCVLKELRKKQNRN